MENLFLSAKEHKILKRHKKWLEKSHGVEIMMPKVDTSSFETDIIFASIRGRKEDIKIVKNFISRTVQNNESKMSNVIVVTLSDSEESSSDSEHEASSMSVQLIENEQSSGQSQNESVIIIDEVKAVSYNSSSNNNTSEKSTIKKFKKAEKVRQNAVSSSVGNSELCEVTSTTTESNTKKRHIENVKSDEDAELAPDFLSLIANPDSVKVSTKKNKLSPAIIHSSEVLNGIERPLNVPRCLRPIIIDGSNVARDHGKSTKTFSSKGIQIAIEYFLNRGHDRITAFVPLFRRHRVRGAFPTSDLEILEKLHEQNHVTFTPSRKLNGKSISPYDDRFIVELASTNNGVIVSNDNFKDLVDESEDFRKAIEERLLMFCFVGDVFMVPKDPLGRNGPSLDDYLSFPSESDNEKEISVIELS